MHVHNDTSCLSVMCTMILRVCLLCGCVHICVLYTNVKSISIAAHIHARSYALTVQSLQCKKNPATSTPESWVTVATNIALQS